MEKTKRISKSSIAIIVLAVLLALSLVMGLTGAWFTDYDAGHVEQTLTFGKVAVDIDDADGTAAEKQVAKFDAGANSFSLALPGDVYTVQGSLTNSSTVKTYMLVTFTAYLKNAAGTAMYRVYDAATAGNELILIDTTSAGNGLAAKAGNLWAKQTGDNALYVTGAGENFFIVEAASETANENILEAKGTITLEGEKFKNHVWLQEVDAYGNAVQVGEPAAAKARTEVLMNGNTDGYQLVVNVEVRAIQFNHIEAQESPAKSAAQVAYEYLKAGNQAGLERVPVSA